MLGPALCPVLARIMVAARLELQFAYVLFTTYFEKAFFKRNKLIDLKDSPYKGIQTWPLLLPRFPTSLP